MILCLIAVLFLSATASAEITFVLKDGSKVTWGSYTETRTHYCKGSGTDYCIDKADVDTIREVIGNKRDNSSQEIEDLKTDLIILKRLKAEEDILRSSYSEVISILSEGSTDRDQICPKLNNKVKRALDSVNYMRSLNSSLKNKEIEREIDDAQLSWGQLNLRIKIMCKE